MRIYVGSLPNGYRLSELIQLFESFGCVSRVTAIRDFAFLAIYDNEAAQAAINALNCTRFGNQEIVVERARFPRRFQQNRGGFNQRGIPNNGNSQANASDNQSQQQQQQSNAYQGQGQNHNQVQLHFSEPIAFQPIQPIQPIQQGNGYQGNNGNSGWSRGNESNGFAQSQAPRGRRGRRGGRGGGNQSSRPSITNPGTPSQTIQEISFDSPPLYTPTATQQYNQAPSTLNAQPNLNLNNSQPQQNNNPGVGGGQGQGQQGGRGRSNRGGGGRRGRRGRGGILRGSSSALQVSELEGAGMNENGPSEGGVVVPDKAGVSSMEAGDRAKVGLGTMVSAAVAHQYRQQVVMAAAPDGANGLGRGGGDM